MKRSRDRRSSYRSMRHARLRWCRGCCIQFLAPLAIEQLESRLTLTGNIAVTSASVVDAQDNPITTVTSGEWVYIQAQFTTQDLPSDASYRIGFTVNGLTLDTGYVTYGAGSSGMGNWLEYWGSFIASPGLNQVTVTIAPDNSVAESSYADNTTRFTFDAVAPAVDNDMSYTVAQMRAAYGLDSIPDFGPAPADGFGQTIALVEAGNEPSIVTDLDGFDEAMSLTTNSTPTLYKQYGPASSIVSVYNQYGANITASISNSGSNGVPAEDPTGEWEGEETMDVEWAHAIAPGAKIDIIEVNDDANFRHNLLVGDGIAANLPGVSAVSNSWDLTEESGDIAYDSSTFVTPSGHTGITFVASSGDDGAYAYGGHGPSVGGDGYYPATSPNVLSVGGTELNLNNDAYASEKGWSYPRPANTIENGSTSYQQIGAWSSQSGGFSGTYTTAAGGSSSSASWTMPITPANTGWVMGTEMSATWTASPNNATDATYTIYDGAQASGAILGTVSVDQTRPPAGTVDGSSEFQELGVFFPTLTNDTGVLTVVLDAKPANGTVVADAIGAAQAWASAGGPSLIESEPDYQLAFQNTGYRTTPDVSFDASQNSGVTCYQNGSLSYGNLGTSLGSPCWAGLIAIVNQGRVALGGTTLNSSDNAQQAVQAIYSLPASDFHDVTSGYNGFSAGLGYDFITGLGTPIANLLVPDLVVQPSDFIVTNVNDSGPGSLRQAIIDANANPGRTITFNIPGSGIHIIEPRSPLPPITALVAIDGTSQPGYDGTPLIALDGESAGSSAGLTLLASDCVVRGFDIQRFSGDGIMVKNGGGNVIAGNYIGLDISGRSPEPGAVAWYKAENNTDDSINHLEGTLQGNASFTAGQVGQAFSFAGDSDEVFVGNSATGPLDITGNQITVEGWVYQTAASQSGNPWNVQAIAGKWYDTSDKGYLLQTVDGHLTFGVVTNNGRVDDTSTSALPLNTWVHVAGTYDGQTIRIFENGTLVASAPQTGNMLHSSNDFDIGNVFSGLGWRGSIDELTVYDRALDTDELASIVARGASGKPGPMGNQGDGIALVNSSGNTIGGATLAARNIVSGNGGNGIDLDGAGTANNAIEGNLIGTDVTGSSTIGNREDGVFIVDGANSNRVGVSGADADAQGEANVVSGNGYDGVGIEGTGTNSNWVAGNLIGTDETGLLALGGNHYGVRIGSGASSDVVGTNVDGIGDATESNVIAGNLWGGVFLTDSGTNGNSVVYNYIGTTNGGAAALPNGGDGVDVANGSSDAFIWSNVVAFNDATGVAVDSGVKNSFEFNFIYGNGGLGIDLGSDGVTPNHPGGSASGPNNWQNYPTIDSVSYDGTNMTVQGVLNSTPNTSFYVYFYASPHADASGYGEGQRVLYSETVTTDAAGNAAFADTFGAQLASGDAITCTATNSAGGTSEFSQATSLPAPATGTALIADGLGNLFRVDLQTGAAELLGQMAAVMGDIAEDPTGNLFAVNQGETLFKINPANGATESTVLLHTDDDSSFPTLNALESRSDGQLFAAGGGSVYEVNTGTGLLTSLAVGLAAGEQSAGDLAFDSNGDLFITTTEGRLLEVPSGYTTSRVVASGLPTDLFGLVATSDTLFIGFSSNSKQIYEIGIGPLGGSTTLITGPTISMDAGLPSGINGATLSRRVQPTVTWSEPADIIYGDALGTTQLDATASVPGSFSYTLADGATAASGAVLNAGQSQVLNVTFTPTDTSDYMTATYHVVINVHPAPLTVTASDQSKAYGTALPGLTISYSGFVNGDTAANLTTQPTVSTSATAGSHVSNNPYAINVSGAVDADYTISYVAGAFTITPAPLTITANDRTKVYGAALPVLTVSYSGFVNGDNAAGLTAVPSLSTTATASSHVSGSPYAITASGAIDTDYTISYVSGALTVTPAALTITANDSTKVYGAALPVLAVSYSGFVNGENAASLTAVPSLSATATASSHVSGSPYAITAGGALDADYTISYVAGALTVTRAPLTIIANDQIKVYGAALPTFTAGYAGFVNGDGAAGLTTLPLFTTTATASSHVLGNPYAIAAHGAVDADYTISYVSGTLTVTPAALTITADDQSKVYGAPLPVLTVSYNGFVNGDTTASLAAKPTLSTSAVGSSHVSGNPYTITAGGASDVDYAITYVTGALTVTPAVLTITADDKGKAYGAALPALTASYSGFVNGDNAASLTALPSLSATATAGSHVSGSPYAINVGGTADSDYTFNYLSGALAVSPASLTITANDKSTVYGAAFPALTVSYAGFVNGDNGASLTTPPTVTTTAAAGSHVAGSPYSVTVSGAVDADYSINYVAGALTVMPAPLTITADDKSKIYGAALPTFTASYAGFVNGDTAASLTAQPTLATTALGSSHVSGNSYAITVGGAADGDYTISYVPGSLTVTPAPLTITADDKSKVYGAALPALTESYSGFVNGDTVASLTTPATLATTATGGSHVSGSPYVITASGAVDPDYTISYVAGALSVTPVQLTITADDKSKVYGAALPALTASYSGLVNGDNAASLTPPPTLSTVATAGSHVSGSPYAIMVSGAVDADYTISYAPGTLIVTPAALTITADDKSKVYGAALPTLTAGYSGFINGDNAASLTTPPALSTTATAGSHVSGSPYAIIASGAVDADYRISYLAGGLTVTPAPLTVTANDKSKVYGATLPALAASYAGFVNGDSEAGLTTPPSFSTTATAGSHVLWSPYAITASGAVDADYTISYVPGALTVMPATLTITANDKSKVYGAALPTLTVSYSGFVNGDSAASLTTAPNLSTTATAGSHFLGSPYGITASGAVDADYSISYVSGVLAVVPAPLTITAEDKSKVYGAALPALTASYSSFVNGDSAATLTTLPALATTATARSHVSGNPYAITASGAVDTDYTITYVPGALTVTPVPLTITADDKTKVYGAAVPRLTASYLGFVNGDSNASLTTAPSLSTTATSGSHVSGNPYVNSASGAVDADYAIGYVAGAFTVTPAALTVTANDASRAYGAANPEFTDTISGFVNGDSPSVVSGVASLSTPATAASAAGSYPILAAADTLSAADYTFSFQNATLTVKTGSQSAFALADDIYVIGSGTVTVPATSGVLTNDSGPGQLAVSTGNVIGANGGTFVFHADGSFTYTPPGKFTGFDHAQYTASDSQGDHGAATVDEVSQPGGVVWKFYESVLGRNPDYGGLGYWINDFVHGGKTGDIAVGFFESDELLDEILGGYYQQYLGRALDAHGLAYWQGVWHATGGPEGIKAGFAASAEFNDHAGNTANGWVTALYNRILDRAPDPQGFAYWQGKLASGMSEYDIALSFFDSSEAFRNDVAGWFDEYLGRTPTDAELRQYAGQMSGGKSDRDIEQEITNLPEYGQHPPASPTGTADRLPDYYPPSASASNQQAAVAAKDAMFAELGR